MKIFGARSIKQRGFSIVELMVAILIGLIILAGVIQVVVTSRSSFLGQEEMSFIQENARYAMDVIGKDIQSAGYWGCAGSNAKVAIVPKIDASHNIFLNRRPVTGFEGADAAPLAFKNNIRAETDFKGTKVDPDSILVQGFRGQTHVVESNPFGTLTLATPTSLDAGDFVGVVAEDCKRIGIFKAAGRGAGGVSLTYGTDHNYTRNIKPGPYLDIICIPTGGTCSNGDYSQPYQRSSSVMAFESVAYYVGNSTALSGAPAMPALKRAVLTHDATNGSRIVDEEIALGVENMQILYGVIIYDNALRVETLQYFPADLVPDWNNVASVQISLLFRSISPSQPSTEVRPDMLGNEFQDRFARQIVTSTFRLRNRS